MKNLFFSLILFFAVSQSALSQQLDDTRRFIDDMLMLAERFAQPAADAAGYQASAGWFSSAAILDPWEFRVSIHGNALIIPEDRKTFSLQNSELQLLQIEGIQSTNLPTAFGGATGTFFTGELEFTNPINGETVTESVRFPAFEGIGRNFVPHAFAQIAIGLPAGSEITLRAMPEITIDGVTASTFGAGIKHNFSQYFSYNEPEDWQLAGAIAYSKLKVEYGFVPIEVEQYLMMNLVDVDADLWMIEAIASKRWGYFELFGAAGAAISNFSYEMGGGGPILFLVNSEIDNLENSQTQFKGDLGFNLHLGVFRLSAMATVGEFLNANMGLHVRI